jgi:hypothetical protein
MRARTINLSAFPVPVSAGNVNVLVPPPSFTEGKGQRTFAAIAFLVGRHPDPLPEAIGRQFVARKSISVALFWRNF